MSSLRISYWFLKVILLYALCCFESVRAETAPLIIRNIKIIVRDVFEKTDDAFFYETANALKINTKQDIVKRELLFKEGDVYDKFIVSESGRNLRSLPFLRNITIIETIEDGFVDFVISVQDTWTLFPIISVSSGSGANSQSVGIVEGNLGGYGKRIEGLIEDDEGRRKYEAVWDDRRFLGTLQRFSLGHFERVDGRSSLISWGQPFRSLVNKEAWFVDLDSTDLVGRLFDRTDERYIFRQKTQSFMGGYTFSSGNPSELLSRFTLGYKHRKDQFSEADDSDFDSIGLERDSLPLNGGQLADDREFSGPVFSWQLIEPKFISLNYVDFFDRVQDFNLGNELVLNMHVAPTALGSLRDSLIFRLTETNGLKISPQEFMRGQLSFAGRLENDTVEQAVFSAQGRYYRVFGPRYLGDIYMGQHTIASSFNFDAGFDLDNDTEFLLGAENGLRGYTDRSFSGSHRMSFNLEDRVHLVDDVLKLMSIGAAAFVDVGSVSKDKWHDTFSKDVYANVGVGLRLGLNRSSGGTVVRIDVAIPMRDGPDGSSKFEPLLLFTTGQLFKASLRSDALGLTTPSVSAGFVK